MSPYVARCGKRSCNQPAGYGDVVDGQAIIRCFGHADEVHDD